jgi:hypothetical protein
VGALLARATTPPRQHDAPERDGMITSMAEGAQLAYASTSYKRSDTGWNA